LFFQSSVTVAGKPFRTPGSFRLYEVVVKAFADGQVQSSDGKKKSRASLTRVTKIFEKYKEVMGAKAGETSKAVETVKEGETVNVGEEGRGKVVAKGAKTKVGQTAKAGEAPKVVGTAKEGETVNVGGEGRGKEVVAKGSKAKAGQTAKAGEKVKGGETGKAGEKAKGGETGKAGENGPGKKVEVGVEIGRGKKASTEKSGGKTVKESNVKGKRAREEEEEPEASGSEEERGGKTTKGLGQGTTKPRVHKDGGRMTVPRKRTKVVKSAETVESSAAEEEAKPKPKPKPKPKVQLVEDEDEEPKSKGSPTKGKRSEVIEDDEEEDEDEEKDDEDEEENDDEDKDGRAPLERARARPRKKTAPRADSKDLPKFVEVDDKCGRCAKSKERCFWTIEAIKKSGPKACMACNSRKIGCVSGFKNSGPVILDLNTPLDNFVELLAPPPSSADDVPRPGIVGESSNNVETLGQLFIELINTTRAAREETAQLRAEVKSLATTLNTMVTYDDRNHRAVMDEFDVLPSRIVPPKTARYNGSTRSTPLRRTTPLPMTAAHIPSPTPPISPLLIDFADGPSFGDSDDEGTPPPDPSQRQIPRAASSASRAVVGEQAEGDDEDADGDEDEQEEALPSVVANRTRGKTKPTVKPTPSPAGTKHDGSDGEGTEEVGTKTQSRKRKAPVGADEEGEDGDKIQKKKPRAAPKKPTKAKPAAKKAT